MKEYLNKIIQGDCLEVLKTIPDNSVDSIVTDPPYEIGFMGKSWDSTGISNNIEMWAECLRVLKPGGHLLSFSSTRTYHRMAAAIEDAGFEVRDMIEWIYSTGFPKSLNLNKALQKKCSCGNMVAYDNKRTKQNTKHDLRQVSEGDLSQEITDTETKGEVLLNSVSEQSLSSTILQFPSEVREGQSSLERGNNVKENSRELSGNDLSEMPEGISTDGEERRLHNATQVSDGSALETNTNENGSGASHRPQSEKQQDREPCAFCKQFGTQETRRLYEATYGLGSALKPAHEPICLARKPLSEKTLVDNFIKYGTGGINIDESRVAANWKEERPESWFNSGKSRSGNPTYDGNLKSLTESTVGERLNDAGRFPANLIHDNSEEVRECFPETKSGSHKAGQPRNAESKTSYVLHNVTTFTDEGSSGNASRFFKSIIYQAKSSKAERNKGLDNTLTVKYNGSICKNKKEENMVAVQLLQKVISEQELVSFSTEESGENIMVQCQLDSLSTILTETKRIIGLKIYHLLMLSLTNDSTQVANSEMEVGGNLAESVADLKRWLLTTTKGNQELALGASRVVLETLQLISEKENWKNLGNFHSTVKPIALMEYLIKMVTPKGGIVLDPFMGSGSTGVATKLNGYGFIGIELNAEYIKIAEKRIQGVTNPMF